MALDSQRGKRPFPFPLIHEKLDEKRERRASQSSEASTSSTTPANQNDDNKLKCKLCNNRVSFKNAEDFDFHLTMIHYRDQLSDLLGDPPYFCKRCGFEPTADDPNEEMILHFGCRERLAIKYYLEECQKREKSLVVKKEPNFHKNTVTCKICNVLSTNQQLFLVHITQKHYAEEIRQKIPSNAPYICPKCNQDKQDKQSLVMHFGIDHEYSSKLYQEYLDKTEPKKEKQQNQVKEIDMFKPKELITCKLCRGKKFLSTKQLKYHLTLNHFFSDVMKDGFARCPKCRLKFGERNEFAKHFIEEHFEDYVKNNEFEKKKEKEERRKEEKKKNEGKRDHKDEHKKDEKRRDERKKDDSKDRREERRKSSSKSNRPDKLEVKDEQIPGCLDNSLTEELPSPSILDDKPLPKCRERQTIHEKGQESKSNQQFRNPSPVIKTPTSSLNNSSARQRMMNKWKSTSIDSQKFEFEKLQCDISTLKEDHSNALKKKAEEFERWIDQKEKSIEEEVKKRKDVEGTLELASVEIAELKAQLEQSVRKVTSLEDTLVDEHKRYSEMEGEKKEIEQQLAAQKVIGQELCDFQSYIEKMKTEAKEVKSQLATKTEDLIDLQEEQEKLKSDHEKQVNKLTKQQETLKTKHEKVMEEKKEKMSHIREITKLHKELESDQKNQINRLNKEKEELKKEVEAASKAETKIKVLEESKIGKKLKALEEEKKENANSVKLLESQRNALLDSLERIQKILQGFESVIKDKNENIGDLSTKLEESEINLEEALQRLSSSKEHEKEKKESQKLVKQLQASLRDYEFRQFTNAKLISGLEKEKAALEKKLNDEKSSSKKAAENSIISPGKMKKLENDTKCLRESQEKAERELAKAQALLNSKTSELICAHAKLLNSEQKVKNLERQIRNPTNMPSANDETENLKLTIETLSERYARLKEQYQNVVRQSNINSEPDSTNQNKVVEALKHVARETQNKLNKKEKEYDKLLKAIKEMKASNGGVNIKIEPQDEPEPQVEPDPLVEPEPQPSFNVQQVDTEERQIVLDINTSLLVDQSPVSQQSNASPNPLVVDPYDYHNEDVDIMNRFASPAYPSDNESRVGSSNGSFSPRIINNVNAINAVNAVNTVNNANAVKKKPTVAASKGKGLVDVTQEYDESEDDITCGICEGWDPPLPPPDTENETNANKKKKDETYTTSWVGCDCGRWYHKQCTSRKRFTAAFSCKSVKRKCQKAKKS